MVEFINNQRKMGKSLLAHYEAFAEEILHEALGIAMLTVAPLECRQMNCTWR